MIVEEYTADWCINCKFLEAAVLETPAVRAALAAEDVAAVKVDLTGNNEPGRQKLAAAGRNMIPLLVIYDRAGNEVFKSDAYTTSQVLAAIETARKQ